MSLTAELMKVLDDENQPLVKRLKIADNAFKSREISIPHREFVLLKWITELKIGDITAWDQCYKWISSYQVRELNRSDISAEDINVLLEMILKNLSTNLQGAEYMVNIVSSLIEIRVFQQHFKFDMKCYCNFISNIVININDENLMLKFIQNDQLFNKSLFGDEKFYKYFIDYVLISLSNAALKFKDNILIFEAMSKVLQKSLFRKNQKQFEEYFAYLFNEIETKEKSVLPKQLIKKLKTFYELDNSQAQYAFHIIFHSFCSAYNNNFSLIYKFFVLVNINLGINITSFNVIETNKAATTLNKSLLILAELLDVISKNNNTLLFELNEVSFNNFLQTLILSIIAMTKYPNETCYKILQKTLEINPLIIESVISHVIIYIMLSDNRKYSGLYEKLFISIFEMYSKLHRIQNLISKLIRSLESKFNGSYIKIEPGYEFDGVLDMDKNKWVEYDVNQLVPNVVIKYFANCVMSLASWQVMNLYKTLLFHLSDSVQNDLPCIGTDNNKKIYVEIICKLMCQFLSSVRIAEHTVSTEVLKKFANSMNDFKILLGKFGTALVSMEHNQTLMKAYLTVCYTWAELFIILRYYSLEEDTIIKNESDSDFAACNITYLHSYLTSEQWCLISERITNFGEKPCKQIMQNLCIQKLRAKMIFERELSDDILLPVTHNASARLEDYYKCLINDRFSLTTIVNRMDRDTILKFSNYLLTDLDTGKYNILKKIKDSKPLLYGMVYSCMERINNLFKSKRKVDQNNLGKFQNSKIFNEIMSAKCLNSINTDDILKKLKDCIEIKGKLIDFKIDEEKLKRVLEVIKLLPVIYLEDDMKIALFSYFSALLIDLNTLKNSIQSINDVENILKELIILCNIPIVTILHGTPLMKFITNYMKDYKDVFENIADYCIKNEDHLEELDPCIKFITTDLSEMDNMYSCITMLNLTQKHKKSKLSEVVKKKLDNYKNQICDKVVVEVSQEANYKSIHIFALVLKIYLDSKDSTKIEIMKKELKAVLDIGLKQELVVKDQTGWLTLFITILQNKTMFEKLIKPDFILNIWNVSNRLDINNEDTELYAKFIVEIFEHIPNEHFKNVSIDLVENTKSALIADNINLFMKYLKIWNSILTCCFNPTKAEVWQNSIQNLLAFICFEYAAKNDAIWEEVINFETKLIQNSFLIISPATLDIIFYTITQIMEDDNNFHKNFSSCVTILESLVKHRKPLLYDRLPSYLQQYRLLIKKLCIKSNSNIPENLELLQDTSNCAHQLEKLTKQLINLNKHVASICMYVIADVLQHYETITLYPAVKIHIDNCLYSLISLCDQHAIACLMRVLSTASTEIFKVIYETYKKYYRFVGKV